MSDKRKGINSSKTAFTAAVIVCFVSILIYEILTPMMMDDMSYLREVKRAGSFFALFGQEYNQYMTWTGRSIAHITLRMIMYIDLHLFGGGRIAFNILASAVFTLLTVLIYKNIQRREKYDLRTYVLIVLLLWVFGISFSQTVLWETGACNYLFTTTIIMGFITYFRSHLEGEAIGGEQYKSNEIVVAVIAFVLGILAGWCNENTSGGCLLFVAVLSFMHKRSGKKLRPFVFTGLLGNVMGLAFMVLAPGNAYRSSVREELHSGLLGLAARFLNLTLMVRTEFFILFAVLIVMIVYHRVYGKKWNELFYVLLYAALSIITTYSLVATVTPQSRALFGSGVFLIMAVVQAYQEAEDGAMWVQVLRKSAVYLLCLYMFFTYLDCGASIARIYREENERFEYLEKVAATGEVDVTVPMLRPQFENRYTAAYDCDITEDYNYWTNMMMAEFYGFDTITGVERDEWTGY